MVQALIRFEETAVDFTLSETQQAVRGVITDVLDRDTAGWKALASAGLLGIAVPEEYGGEGLGLPEVGVMLHEVGRRAVALPVWETLACGVLTLTRSGTPEQRAVLLPEVAAGESILAAALQEPGMGIPATPGTTLRKQGERLLLSGRKVGVAYAADAYRILVPAGVSGVHGAAARSVVLLDPGAPGVTVMPTRASRGEVEATLVLDDVEVGPEDVLGGLENADAADHLRRHATAGLCLLGDGLVSGARDLTAGYVSQRRQFGRALAEFQAVAQQMADVYVASRTIGVAATSAAWRLSVEGETRIDTEEDLAVAAYWFAVEGPAALHTCHHLHGGMGVDVTYPLHAYYSWAKDIARALGGTHLTLDAVAARAIG